MRIGEAASRIGVPSHVLRHWEDAGVLIPERTMGDQREYDAESVARGRLVLLCQAAGMSLADIAGMASSGHAARVAAIEDRRMRIAEQIRSLRRADGFLGHVLSCSHPIVTECPDCAAFADASVSGRPRRRRARIPAGDALSDTSGS
ncbi:MerR family transcriptional regulator [Tsukamurella sp. 8F]|uniref:helix-turn-helix domain-containing protein n=1 Tax=unclassified Tsukamurella TaxID=2633480 RepID=UPI0023BA216C|nr:MULTISPECIES: MerR family transcriptional regulator [unclassified Tsukamurella]MDF0528402.1 MerR family transcriptional regulator [Tsukamurella sp. 8J]MDF0586227.1 MerR family transcriptional regulator [Tsukamurella sp. 8F]